MVVDVSRVAQPRVITGGRLAAKTLGLGPSHRRFESSSPDHFRYTKNGMYVPKKFFKHLYWALTAAARTQIEFGEAVERKGILIGKEPDLKSGVPPGH